MPHDLDSHLAWRPPPPYVSVLGDTNHVHQIMMGMLAVVDECEPCTQQIVNTIADDPQRMLTLHDVMRGLAGARDEVVMDPAPAGTDVQLALLPYETRQEMVLEGISWMGNRTREVNGWWETWLGPKP